MLDSIRSLAENVGQGSATYTAKVATAGAETTGPAAMSWPRLGKDEHMAITNALASLAVADLDASSRWYEVMLGPGSRPMPDVVEWQLAGGGALQVYKGAERAGGGSCTLIVNDIDAMGQHLRTSGVAPDAEPVRHDRVDTIMIKDPDGNSIAFAMPKDGSLAS